MSLWARRGSLVRGRIRIGSGIAAIVGSLFFGAGESAADWKVYVQGGIGLSGADVDTDGQAVDAVVVKLGGQDSDSTPLLDAAVGLEVPMDELVPREALLKVRLPSWPVRFEVEAAGLREWEFQTAIGTGGDDFFTQLKATTVLFNSWVDVPLVSAWKPFQYLFGLGRQPRVRQWMDPMSIYVGTGIGLTAQMKVDGTSNDAFVRSNIVDFAWNVGTGINYKFSDNVKLSIGYRYVGLPKVSMDINGNFSGSGNDKLDYDLGVHELRVAVRVLVWEFPSPWR
jgi:hypothetical protein